MTDADFEKIPELIASPDAVVFGTKTKGKRDQIGYIKRQPDGSTLYLEEVRTGRKELAAVSMRKFAATMDADRLAANLHPNAQDDGIKPIVVRKPSADNAEPGETRYQSGMGETGQPIAGGEGAGPQNGIRFRLPGGARGWMRRLPDGSFEIGKTKIGDFSTLVHETAHLYLDTIGAGAAAECQGGGHRCRVSTDDRSE